MSASATPDLNEETRQVWDGNAQFWDERMGEGNLFHLTLVAPAAERLLAIQPGERVLEFACGNGQFSRRLAELGATVYATDFAPGMIAAAEVRSVARPELAGKLTFALLDATSEHELAELPAGAFDAAVCNMGIMDMAEIAPMFRAIRRSLRPGGRFVFTICHPCFNQSGATQVMEQSDRGGEMTTQCSIKVHAYLGTGTQKGLAIIGQPNPQWYFNRPFSLLLNEAFSAGLVMDGIEEPAFPPPVEMPRRFSWDSMPEIPPLLAVRLRPA